MQTLRASINAVFLLGNLDEDREKKDDYDLSIIVSRVRQVLDDIQSTANVRVPSVKELQEARRDEETAELDTATQLADLSRASRLHETQPRNVEDLCRVIRDLRSREQQQDFHSGLLRDQRRLTAWATESYTAENFAYGSTPFQTWMLLTTQSPVISAIKQMQQPDRTTASDRPRHSFTVFGSSSGSLALFTALAYDIPVQGIEILPFLHQEAERLRALPSTPSDCCRFICADMLAVSLANSRILVLTSQCWDAELYARVQRKLERELPDDALVIDYKDGLARSTRFRLLQKLEGQRVSWTSSQPLFLFRKM